MLKNEEMCGGFAPGIGNDLHGLFTQDSYLASNVAPSAAGRLLQPGRVEISRAADRLRGGEITGSNNFLTVF